LRTTETQETEKPSMEKEEIVLSADRPTSAAELTVIVREDVAYRQRDGATYVITTVGILGTVCVGIGGAVLTARDPHLSPLLPCAELALALVAVVLLATRDLLRRRRRSLVPDEYLRSPGALASDDQPEPRPG
jgi:hypothetical protein